MVVQLAAIWIASVIAFFVLWALLAKFIKRFSEKKEKENSLTPNEVEKNVQNDNPEKDSI